MHLSSMPVAARSALHSLAGSWLASAAPPICSMPSWRERKKEEETFPRTACPSPPATPHGDLQPIPSYFSYTDKLQIKFAFPTNKNGPFFKGPGPDSGTVLYGIVALSNLPSILQQGPGLNQRDYKCKLCHKDLYAACSLCEHSSEAGKAVGAAPDCFAKFGTCGCVFHNHCINKYVDAEVEMQAAVHA